MIEKVLNYVDSNVDAYARWRANDDSKTFDQNRIAIYTRKVATANSCVVTAIIAVALAVFSLIPGFSAGLIVGGALLTAYAFERSAGIQADKLFNDDKSLSQTDRLKKLASDAGIALPEDWKAYIIEFKGIGLRNAIPLNPPKKEDSKLENEKPLERKDESLETNDQEQVEKERVLLKGQGSQGEIFEEREKERFEKSAGIQADKLFNDDKSLSQTDRLKKLASDAGIALPEDSNAHIIEFKGIGLRNAIPLNPPKKEDSKLENEKLLERKDESLETNDQEQVKPEEQEWVVLEGQGSQGEIFEQREVASE